MAELVSLNSVRDHQIDIKRFIQDVSVRPEIWNRTVYSRHAQMKSHMDNLWVELEQEHELPIPVIKTKWNSLRDKFLIEFKKIPTDEKTGILTISPEKFDSKWLHYKDLLFLVEPLLLRKALERQKTNTKPADSEIVSDCEEMDTSAFHIASLPTGLRIKPLATLRASINSLKPKPNFTIPPAMPPLVPISAPKSTHTERNQQRPADTFVPDLHFCEPDPPIKLMDLDDDQHFLMSLHPYLIQLNRLQKLKTRIEIQKLISKELFNDK